MSPTKIRSAILLALPIVTALAFTAIVQILILKDPNSFTNWVKTFGPYIILLYIIIQPITIIIAPIGGFALTVALLSIFDPLFALSLIYIVSAPVFVVNFYLARRFGRPLVEKLIGKHSFKVLDNYVDESGTLTLIILRVFQSGQFDYISYAAGLTKIPLKTFILVDFLAGLPALALNYFIFTRFGSLTAGVFALMITAYILTATSIFISHQLRKRNKK